MTPAFSGDWGLLRLIKSGEHHETLRDNNFWRGFWLHVKFQPYRLAESRGSTEGCWKCGPMRVKHSKTQRWDSQRRRTEVWAESAINPLRPPHVVRVETTNTAHNLTFPYKSSATAQTKHQLFPVFASGYRCFGFFTLRHLELLVSIRTTLMTSPSLLLKKKYWSLVINK